MANEYLLKMIVNGLHTLAADTETLCGHLNLRAVFHGRAARFKPARYKPPGARSQTSDALQADAADSVARIAEHMSLFVAYLGGTPASVEACKGVSDDADLLRLIIDWGTLQSGAFKAIVQLYGRQPAPTPGLPNPGAASEQRLWAEIVAWFEKIAADTERFAAVQDFATTGAAKKRAAAQRSGSALVRMEQGVHRTTLDTLQIAGLLPYHLYHAARAGQRSGARR
jgi:hypothetical protein